MKIEAKTKTNKLTQIKISFFINLSKLFAAKS